MKHFNLMALMALTLTMGMTLTSCFGSDGKNKTEQSVIALYQNGTLEQYGGGILVPTNTNYLPSSPGIYTFGIEYDPTTWSDNKLSVTITSKPISLNNPNVRVGADPEKGNINLYDLEYNNMKPEMFNQDYILVPCIYWMDDVTLEGYDNEEAKHKFTLLVPEDLHSSDGVLNLTLIDEVSDPGLERYKTTWVYQAFNLKSAITGFKSINGKINTIRIWGNVNRNSYDPEEGRTSKKYVDIDLTVFQ